MRYWAFILYAAGSIVLFLWALSDFVYGSTPLKKLAVRMVLCIVWPFALLSQAGRETLLFFGKEGNTDGGGQSEGR